jgi:hypothetical protein
MADRGAKLYEEWHWGIPHQSVQEWKDEQVDGMIGPEGLLIETGRLVELHFREPHKRKDTVVKLKRNEANGSHLAFDPEHPHHRLYIFSHPKFAERMHKRYLQDEKYKHNRRYESMPLAKAAKIVGGKHATSDYPKVQVSPVGILTHVVYATEKKGDGFSFYIHKMGEESGIKPALTIDDRGRLWIAGGNYTSPNPGITD